MSPWGAGNFADPGAVWIWNERNAASTAVAAECECICADFHTVVSVDRATPVIVHIIADNISKLRINGVLIGEANGGWAILDYPKLGAILRPGRNDVHIQARNGSVGPAGLLASIVANGRVLSHTDASWSASNMTCDELVSTAPVWTSG